MHVFRVPLFLPWSRLPSSPAPLWSCPPNVIYFNVTARGILLEPKSGHSPSFAQGPFSLMSVSLRIKLKTLTMAARSHTTWPHLSPLIPGVPPPGSQAFFLSQPTKLISNCLCLSCSLQLEGSFPRSLAPGTVHRTE